MHISESATAIPGPPLLFKVHFKDAASPYTCSWASRAGLARAPAAAPVFSGIQREPAPRPADPSAETDTVHMHARACSLRSSAIRGISGSAGQAPGRKRALAIGKSVCTGPVGS